VIFRNRAYERLLEEEVARLRQENRELLNAILPKQGMAPLDAPAPQPESKAKPRSLAAIRQKMTADSAKAAHLFRLELPKWMRKAPNGDEAEPTSRVS